MTLSWKQSLFNPKEQQYSEITQLSLTKNTSTMLTESAHHSCPESKLIFRIHICTLFE